jgi:hypothetical protein
MFKLSQLAFLVLTFAGWISRQQVIVTKYLKAENQMLGEQLKRPPPPASAENEHSTHGTRSHVATPYAASSRSYAVVMPDVPNISVRRAEVPRLSQMTCASMQMSFARRIQEAGAGRAPTIARGFYSYERAQAQRGFGGRARHLSIEALMANASRPHLS